MESALGYTIVGLITSQIQINDNHLFWKREACTEIVLKATTLFTYTQVIWSQTPPKPCPPMHCAPIMGKTLILINVSHSLKFHAYLCTYTITSHTILSNLIIHVL